MTACLSICVLLCLCEVAELCASMRWLSSLCVYAYHQSVAELTVFVYVCVCACQREVAELSVRYEAEQRQVLKLEASVVAAQEASRAYAASRGDMEGGMLSGACVGGGRDGGGHDEYCVCGGGSYTEA